MRALCIYSEPGREPYLISTFRHKMFLNTKPLDIEISRVGQVLTFSLEEEDKFLDWVVKEFKIYDRKYLTIVPLHHCQSVDETGEFK